MMQLDLMLDTVRKGFAEDATAEDKTNAARVLRVGLAMLDPIGAPAPAAASPRSESRPKAAEQPDVIGMLITGLLQRLPDWQQEQIREQVAADVPSLPFVATAPR